MSALLSAAACGLRWRCAAHRAQALAWLARLEQATRPEVYNHRTMHLHAPPSLLDVSAECPCIGHCSTVLGDDVCRGCQRTFEEVIGWPQMNEEERCAVNRRIALEQWQQSIP